MRRKHILSAIFIIALVGAGFAFGGQFLELLLEFMLTGTIPGTNINIPYWMMLSGCAISVIGILNLAFGNSPLKPPARSPGC